MPKVIREVDTHEKAQRWPEDQLLRKWGFVIEARPKRGQATWRLNDSVYTFEEALRIAQEFEADDPKQVKS